MAHVVSAWMEECVSACLWAREKGKRRVISNILGRQSAWALGLFFPYGASSPLLSPKDQVLPVLKGLNLSHPLIHSFIPQPNTDSVLRGLCQASCCHHNHSALSSSHSDFNGQRSSNATRVPGSVHRT